ncbi:MAG TPA: accessory gene regulator B family protein [Firmicutes bacterium]|nr:accessory gene regulator B family protein [Bacillota bacterium]
MERLAGAVGAFLAEQLNLDNDRREQLSYGAFIALQSVLVFVILLAIALLFDIWRQALVIAFTAASLRWKAGGSHLGSATVCTVLSIAVFTGSSLLVKSGTAYLAAASPWTLLLLVLASTLVASVCVFMYAPVEAATRPLRPEHKERLKAASRKLVLAYSLCALVAVPFYRWLGLSIAMGLLLQSFTLTPAGIKIAHILDKK